jgi:hypothetical protein
MKRKRICQGKVDNKEIENLIKWKNDEMQRSKKIKEKNKERLKKEKLKTSRLKNKIKKKEQLNTPNEDKEPPKPLLSSHGRNLKKKNFFDEI